uniref:Pleckstrin homology and RhoGEF domain containing G4 n=1 Tax=Cavia porcellus TaxID=10141 RepID=A0A286Y5K7_CAVPO
MEGPQEVGDEPPDPQSHATDWRFAVRSFRDSWEEDTAPQVQVKDTSHPRLQGGSLSRELQLSSQQRAVHGSGDGQRSTVDSSSVQSEKPPSSGGHGLLCPMTSHLSPGESLVGNPGPGGALPAGNSLPEITPKLQEADSRRSSLPKPADCFLAQDLPWELLASGMASLPGTRDAGGRAVLLLCAHNPAWLHPKCSSHELICLLLYLRGITRPEIQALGLTILVDARICSPKSSLLWGLSQLQEAAPGSVYQVLLVGKVPDEVPAGLQLEHLPSHQSLVIHIPTAGLPTSLGGCLPYCHKAWLEFRMRLEVLLQNCRVVCTLLQEAIESVKVVPQPMESGEVGQLLQQVQILMQQVLDSPQLAWIQCQGGLEMVWLKQEVQEVALSPDYRPAVDKVDELYGRVDGLLHQLTQQSNQRVQALELLQALEAQEGRLHQIEVWLQQVGWPALEQPGEPSLDMLLQAQGPFRELDQVAQKVQFGMYALYSKNKPRSDALMTSYGHAFFKDKQQALGDQLDLASYLLKPIQRMSKYALLLQELARACGGPVQELNALQAAQSLVHFQLRHGNDLLAMDAIQGCDVNLKEQGQLVRQDEFMVRAGRHKSLRRVFLFEELLLFSKPRRGSTGVDTFTYKRSFKMADLGLTECCADSKLRFEIWFRRRKARDTFVLQASSLDIKQAWTTDISRLLWRQAVHNKEARMAEMVSMGLGNKAFQDIAPSEEAINNRSINYVLKCREVRSRASIAVAPLDYESPYLGASSPILGDPASCSVLGSLNLHLYRDPALLSFRWPLYPSNFPGEATLEAEVELGSQPSLTPEDSEVSSQCPSASGSSGSDSSCVSGQVLDRGLEDLSHV